MRAILIDPRARSVMAVQFSGNFDDISKEIGCEMVQPVPVGAGCVMWVDEEGLLKDKDLLNFFKFRQFQPIFAGKCLILGGDADNFKQCTLNVAWLQDVIEWADVKLVGWEISTADTDKGTVITNSPVFRGKDEKLQ